MIRNIEDHERRILLLEANFNDLNDMVRKATKDQNLPLQRLAYIEKKCKQIESKCTNLKYDLYKGELKGIMDLCNEIKSASIEASEAYKIAVQTQWKLVHFEKDFPKHLNEYNKDMTNADSRIRELQISLNAVKDMLCKQQYILETITKGKHND